MKKKRILLLAVTLLFWFAQYVYVPYQTPYLAALGIAPSMIGVILGAYGFTQMAIRMPVGVMADRKNRHKWFIALGVLLAGLASLLRAFVPAAVAFLAANLLSGIASSIWISFTVLFSSYYSPKELTKSMGTITAFNNGGILLGFATGSVVSQTAGIPPLFLLSFLSGMLGFAISLFIKEEKREQAPLPVKELLKVLKSKRLILFAVASATLQAIHMSTAMAFTSQVAEGLGGSNAQIGLCSIIYMVFCIVSSWYVGTRQARRIGNRILMPVFFGCMTVYCALVPLVRSLEALYVLQMIGGLGNASLFSLFMAGAIEGVPKEKKSTAMGFYQAIYGIGITLGPVLMGAVVGNAGMTAAYFTMAALGVVGVILVMIINGKRKSGAPSKK